MAKPPNSVEVDLAYAWLFAHPLAADRPQCMIHGDFGVHNAMVRDGRLTGVLDWELAQLGDPAQDIAQARMLVIEDTLPWEEFRAAYLGAGGDPTACARAAVDYQGIWIFAKMSVMLAEARGYYLSGARDDSLMASVAGHSIDRVYQYLARSLKIATD
ncbi:MAG: phosphotransferase [Steroidobacteraceae bacterium]